MKVAGEAPPTDLELVARTLVRKKGKTFGAWDLAPKPLAFKKNHSIALKPLSVFLTFVRISDPNIKPIVFEINSFCKTMHCRTKIVNGP